MESANIDVIKSVESSGIKSFFSNKRNIIITIVILTGFTYFLYRQKIFDKFMKKKDPEETNEDDKNIIDINKDYYIKDEKGLTKINLKEMLELHKFYLTKQQQSTQQQLAHMAQQEQMLQQQEQQQLLQEQLLQQQQQIEKQQIEKQQKEKQPQQKQQKAKPSNQKYAKITKESDENTDEDLNIDEIENLKKELDEIKKKNQALN